MRIAVAGGRGMVGREVVRAARAAGHEAMAVSRASGADVVTGEGLAAALDGVDVVVDVTNAPSQSKKASTRFFAAATTNLLRAGREAGVQHHVALSIVGIDRVDYGYYAGKRAQEHLLLDGADRARVSVLRATQFHEFPAQMLAMIPGPVVPAPRMITQPVAAREVGDALARLAQDGPAGRVPDLAGPEKLLLADLLRRVLHAQGRRRLLLPLWIPGAAGRAGREGALTPTEDGPRGTETFAQWLERTGGRLT